jgi:hypothetical protein
MHSFDYTTAKKYVGKKAVVVGAATSGHDVAHDLANHDIGKWTYTIIHIIQLTFFGTDVVSNVGSEITTQG